MITFIFVLGILTSSVRKGILPVKSRSTYILKSFRDGIFGFAEPHLTRDGRG